MGLTFSRVNMTARCAAGPAASAASVAGMRRLLAALLTAAPVVLASASPAPAAQATAPPPGSVTIAWVGDTILGTRTYGLPPDGAAGSLAHMTPSIRGADLAFGNLEETLSVGGASKCAGSSSGACFAFQGLPSYAGVLPRAGFDVMNVANNHAADYGPDAERQTLLALRRAGIAPTGTPGQIAYRLVDGTRV